MSYNQKGRGMHYNVKYRHENQLKIPKMNFDGKINMYESIWVSWYDSQSSQLLDTLECNDLILKLLFPLNFLKISLTTK